MKINKNLTAWWSEDGEWFCVQADDGVSRTTASLTKAQATLLREATRFTDRPASKREHELRRNPK